MLKKWKYLIFLLLLIMVTGCGGGGSDSAQLVSIALDPTNPSTAVGAKEQFSATGTYSDSTTKDLTSLVTWNSSATGIATVDTKGLATPVTTGTTTITASLGTISGTTNLIVTSATLVSIVVGPTNPNIPIGLTEQLTATGIYSDGTGHDLTNTATWNSSNTSVATCGVTGRVTSVATGTSVISATSGGISGSTTVTATSATLASIAVSPLQPSIAIGFTEQFTATGTYTDGTVHDLTNVATWTTSDSNVATCSSTGMATAESTGTTTITATMATISGSTTLTVTPETLSYIIVTPINATAYLDFPIPQQFTATGFFSDGSSKDITASVTWSSSDQAIAAISNAAGTKGMATPVDAGTVTITATQVVALPIPGTISGSTSFTVAPDSLVSITVTPVDISVALGDSLQFTATGTYADNTTADLTAYVTWSSSEEDVATIGNIGANGIVTTVGEGPTTITATLRNFSDSTTLTVTPPYVPDSSNGIVLYNANCAGCHTSLATSNILGATAIQIQQAISGIGQMNFLASSLTINQIRDIAAALGAP
jgi:uncharacterized protein YjdB